MTIPTTLNFELAGTDARGNTVSVQAQASFLGTAPITVPLTVSPNTVNFSGTVDSLVRPQIQVTAGGPSVAWSASIAFGSNQVPWLNASPVAGTGSGTITLSPVGDLGPGSYQATLIIQAPTAVPQTLNIPISLLLLAGGSGSPAISGNGLVNGASFQPGAAPGMLMSIFGTNLATSTVQASSVPLPMALGGTSVTVNGLAAPVYYASPGQLNIQVPYEVAPGTGQVTVNVGGRMATSTVMISSLLPGIFASGGRIVPFPSGRSGDS